MCTDTWAVKREVKECSSCRPFRLNPFCLRNLWTHMENHIWTRRRTELQSFFRLLQPHGACQAPLSMRFSRQAYWSGLPFPSPGDLPDPGIEPRSPALQADSLPTEPPGKPCEPYCTLLKKSNPLRAAALRPCTICQSLRGSPLEWPALSTSTKEASLFRLYMIMLPQNTFYANAAIV